MTRTILRACIVTPFALLALAAFCTALVVEWLDDLAHTCPPSEKLP
jgi:hypothetical protein